MSISEIGDSSDWVEQTTSTALSWQSSSRWMLDQLSEWGTTAKVMALTLASYLTEPICKVREYYYSFYTLNATCSSTAQKALKVAFLTLGIVTCGLLAPLTAPFGAALRAVVVALEAKPHVYLKNAAMGKALPQDKKITLVSHNQCYMPGGYSITDGQVTPPSDKKRMDANIQKIKELNPDIVCLYEVQDVCDARYISLRLADYPFIIPVAGASAIGPSSMMYIASKYEIAKDSIEFVPFIKGTELTGRARFSNKGFLSFDIINRGEKTPFATIVSTHLQHSEFCAGPVPEDVTSRAAQMHKITTHLQRKVAQGYNVILTGDLNQEEKEINAFFDRNQIRWLRRDPSVQGQPTWGGDTWCSQLVGKPASGPLVLDYTFIAGKATDISTRIFDSCYSGLEFRPDATSDHHLLFNTITVS